VGSPELALNPAPSKASILVDLLKCSWKLSRSFCGTTLGLAADEAILRAMSGSDSLAAARVLWYSCGNAAGEAKGQSVSCVRCLCLPNTKAGVKWWQSGDACATSVRHYR
jgi:hypothetical protein